MIRTASSPSFELANEKFQLLRNINVSLTFLFDPLSQEILFLGALFLDQKQNLQPAPAPDQGTLLDRTVLTLRMARCASDILTDSQA